MGPVSYRECEGSTLGFCDSYCVLVVEDPERRDSYVDPERNSHRLIERLLWFLHDSEA